MLGGIGLGEVEVPAQGSQAEKDNDGASCDRGNGRRAVKVKQAEVDPATGEGAGSAKRRSPEKRGHLVADHVTDHAAEGAGDGAKQCGNEWTDAILMRETRTGDAEESEAKGVRWCEIAFECAPSDLAQNSAKQRHDENNHGIVTVLDPEQGLSREEDVAQCPATEGGAAGDRENANDIHPLLAGKDHSKEAAGNHGTQFE